MAAKRRGKTVKPIDRVLDEGMVTDATAGLNLLGLRLPVDLDAQIVIGSMDTYQKRCGPAVRSSAGARSPQAATRAQEPKSSRNSAPAARAGRPATRPKRTVNRSPVRFSSADLIRARGMGLSLD